MELIAAALALPMLLVTAATRSAGPPAAAPEQSAPSPVAPPPKPDEAAASTSAATPRVAPTVTSLRLRMGNKSGFYVYPAVPPVNTSARALLFFSGDWGWRPVQQQTASYLAAHGRTVVGIDSTEYFSRQLEAADWNRDLATLRAFANEKAGLPPETPVLVAGFTWGATLVPYMLNRGGAGGFAGALLIGPIVSSSCIYRVTLQFKSSVVPLPPDEQFQTADEIGRLAALPVVLMQGAQDTESAAGTLLPMLRGPKQIVTVPGADRQFHDVRDSYFSLTAQALEWLETKH